MNVDSQYNFIARDGTTLSFFRTSAPPLKPAIITGINDKYRRQYNVRVRNAKYTNGYNCHGMTFVGKLGWFDDVRNLLTCHRYKKIGQCINFDIDEITLSDGIQRGDIIVYFLGNEANVTHTGTVWSKQIRNSKLELTILSKWGGHSEYFHRHDKVPLAYGKSIEIWTDRNI